ncbi:MAG: DUF4350 domain-containing protein, partial [Pseudomonadota bacterium]
RVEQERYVGYSGEATYNRFFAAESLMRDRGIEAESQASLTPASWLPAAEDTIVLPMASSLMTPDQSSALYSWVSGGGHLVLLPYGAPEQFTRFLEPFGLRYEETEFAEYEPGEDGDRTQEVPDVDYRLNLNIAYYRLAETSEGLVKASITDDYGMLVARTPYGEGVLTIASAGAWFDNASLDDGDHARLLMDIVAGFYDSGKVWFIYSADFDSLFEMLWQNFPYAVSLFLVLIAAWIISVLPRFGPPVSDAPAERRSVVEHVRAAGLFDWRTGRANGLARSAIDALMHDAEIRHPGIGRLSPEKQAKRLAAITGMDAESILQALMLRDEDNARHFTQHMKTLQMTRDRL